jgi:four helix bundle protein
MVKSYRELIVWQKGIRLAVLVYERSKTFPREDLYGLTSQLRRAAIAIPSKIAEGAGRLSTPDYRHYFGMARGSNFELQTQLTIARELGFGEAAQMEEIEGLSIDIGKMISSTLTSLSIDREH